MAESVGIDLRSIITLLGHHLYDSPDVAIREILQNARDAVYGRYRASGLKDGRIDIRVRDRSTIEIQDNGIGMDAQELVNALSALGTSVKKLGRSLRSGREHV